MQWVGLQLFESLAFLYAKGELPHAYSTDRNAIGVNSIRVTACDI